MKTEKLILNLSDVGIEDIQIAGGKNASLGEMITNLSELGIRVPKGIIITVYAYKEFITINNFQDQIKSIVSSTDLSDIEQLKSCGLAVRQLIMDGVFSDKLSQEITQAYKNLSADYNVDEVDVAVRSSATAEDLPDASFAGQQESYLNIKGIDVLLISVKRCFASLFTDRAISYRENFNYDHFQIGLSVCVQKMVRSDLASSGVAFSIDTESGFKDAVIINGSYGLGELIVQGTVSPDEFCVFKPLIKQGYPAIVEKKLGNKDQKMIYSTSSNSGTEIHSVKEVDKFSFCISDKQVIELAKWIILIEDYYTKLKGRWCPMDVEWAVDGLTRELYVVQARPETIFSRRKANIITNYKITDVNRNGSLILKGIAVGDKIGVGRVNLLSAKNSEEINLSTFKKGDVLVTEMTDPDWEPIMKIASAIVTNKGGRTCHAAIVARELGIPAIVGTGNGTELLTPGQKITVSCVEGETGFVYKGSIKFEQEKLDTDNLPKVATPIMLNVASPDKAFQFSQLPCHGVGLAREEFIINNYIGIHPLALLHYKELNDKELTDKIDNIIRGYANGADFFIEKLCFGIAKIGAAFWPNKVIVRLSDFKSNEYFNLIGGKYYEPLEENPMLGWRGASRYYSSKFREAFVLELKAIQRAREEIGLKNIVIMVPFCRTPNELKLVYEIMNEYGLIRGKDGLEVYLMAELPSNVLLANEFAMMIDGFSIGSNDLTQLVLGLDRDSSLVAHIYDERNEAVKMMISTLINTAKKHKVKVGICGQGPSDFPDFAKFLVEEGIDTISVTPDSFFKVVIAVNEIEKQLLGKGELFC